MVAVDKVVGYYTDIEEDARFNRNSRRIEFLTTTHILEEWLTQQSGGSARMLEVGAGTGAYSLHYAERGQRVTAVDLTPKHVDMIRKKAEERGLQLEAYVENAVDLSRFEDEAFDVVLCFGPLYHLTEEEERRSCIKECLRVLRSGGYLAIAYINKHSIMPMLATRSPSFIRSSVIDKVLNGGVILGGDEDCFWTDAFFTSPDEVEALLLEEPVTGVDHAGTDGISHTIHEAVDHLNDAEFEAWLNYHFLTCREKSIRGISTHGLYICRKN